MFINLVRFPAIRSGREDDFLAWFKESNDAYRNFPGFVSRRLLCSPDGAYAAVVEHQSEATFMAMHTSPDRAAMWEKVEPLIEGRPEPGFFEVVEEARA